MNTNTQSKFFSEQEALEILLRETSKRTEQIDMNLVTECLYYLYPENEEDDRAYIERTLPILHRKLGFDKSPRIVPRRRASIAMVATLVILMLLFMGSAVAYAFGINVLNFFVYGTEEYWMLHIEPTGDSGMRTMSLQQPFRNYDVWGEAVADMMESLDMSPALPTWVPEGYKLVAVKDTSVEDFYNRITAYYKKDENLNFKLIVTRIDPNTIALIDQIEKEDDKSWIENRGGISILYAHNYDISGATWVKDNYEIRIRGTCSMDVIREMIDSLDG